MSKSRRLEFCNPHDANDIGGAVICVVTSDEIDVNSIYGPPANDQHVVIHERRMGVVA